MAHVIAVAGKGGVGKTSLCREIGDGQKHTDTGRDE